jgi:hypothetical protein
MASGQDQLTRLEYKNQLESHQNDHDLLIEIGMQLFDVKANCSRACQDVPARGQKVYNATGVTAMIISVIEGVMIWFRTGGGTK